jgi:hypothetical protein
LNISDFEIVSDFDIRIWNLGNEFGAIKSPLQRSEIRGSFIENCAARENFQP